MKPILQKLYDGEIYPAEQLSFKNKEYENMRKKHYYHYEDFIKKLKPPLHERFMEIMDKQLDLVPIELSETFIEGFKLGAKMIIESVYLYIGKGITIKKVL